MKKKLFILALGLFFIVIGSAQMNEAAPDCEYCYIYGNSEWYAWQHISGFCMAGDTWCGTTYSCGSGDDPCQEWICRPNTPGCTQYWN